MQAITQMDGRTPWPVRPPFSDQPSSQIEGSENKQSDADRKKNSQSTLAPDVLTTSAHFGISDFT
jgi:hypothetical protein